MNSPKKSPAYSNSPEITPHSNGQSLGDRLAKLQLLAALFPHLREESFLLEQLLGSIEAFLHDHPQANRDFANFADWAARLGAGDTNPGDSAFAYLCIDLSGRTWDPLFIQAELVRGLKSRATAEEILVVVHHLADSVLPKGTYRTRSRRESVLRAQNAIEDLIQKWTRPSMHVHVLYT